MAFALLVWKSRKQCSHPKSLWRLPGRGTTQIILLSIVILVCFLPWLLYKKPLFIREKKAETCSSKITEKAVAQFGKNINVISSIDLELEKDRGTKSNEDNIFLVDDKSFHKIECVDYNVLANRYLTICVHDPQKDLQVSKHLKNYGTWEKENIAEMLKAFQMFPDMMLVDLGSNLGIFTLPAAALGREVIAVDALLLNHHLLHQSLVKNDLLCSVSLLHNAVFSKQGQMRIVINPSNIGGSVVREIPAFQKDRVPHSQRVNSICLNDLAPFVQGKEVFLKMDLEGTQKDVFMCADVFFTQANVKVLLMEWVTYQHNDQVSDRIKSFLTSYNMAPTWGVDVDRTIDLQASHGWPDNVFWMKK